MHATQALDYLVLNASERINYRVDKGITLQEWYQSFKPEPLQGDDMGYREACQVLGVSRGTFHKLLDEGYFGETLQGNGIGRVSFKLTIAQIFVPFTISLMEKLDSKIVVLEHPHGLLSV